jgi:predicted amidohydrolase YtcJ
MNKKLLLFLIIVILLITSCGQKEPSPTPQDGITEEISDDGATIQWVAGEEEQGLYLDSGKDFDTEIITVGSPPVEVRRSGNCKPLPSSDGNEEPDCVMQFRVDNSFLFKGSPTSHVQIEVEYFDEGTDSFFIQYDASPGAPFLDGIMNMTHEINKTDTNTFKTAVFILEDAYFGNRLYGADFRIDGKDDGADVIRSVKVTLLEDETETADGADIIFYNGNVLTMDDDQPIAEAVAIQGDKIIAVGDNDSILAYQTSTTKVIDLAGKTMMPGFIDPHSHIIQNPGVIGAADRYEMQDVILAAGVTTIADMGGDRGEVFEELSAMEDAGELRIRISLYLLHTTNCGEQVGDWYLEYPPIRTPGAMLHIPGIKIFTDGGSCNAPAVSYEYSDGSHGDLYYTQEELNQIVADASAHGCQAAIHALGDRAIEQTLYAIKESLVDGENPLRHRIEHNTLVRPEMYPLYTEIKPVALVFGPFHTCSVLGESGKFKYSTPEEARSWEWPYGTLIEANPDVVFAWHEDTPVYPLDPMLHLFGFVTRAAFREDGTICEPPDWLAANAVPVETALKLMTINAAYALFREEDVGSIVPGKYADIIILSDDPLTVDPYTLADIEVWMTMVNGNMEYCMAGHEAYCP